MLEVKQSRSRLESISDAVFGFAATLVVVSLDVPTEFADLKNNLGKFFSFGVSFLGLILIWKVHYNFYRRVERIDNVIVALNMVLLFFVLFFVYPLKFLANISTGIGQLNGLEDLAELFQLYSLGFTLIFVTISLMYWYGSRLSSKEKNKQMMMFCFRHFLIFVFVGILSIVLAFFMVGIRYGIPGFVYPLLGPLCYIHGIKWGIKK